MGGVYGCVVRSSVRLRSADVRRFDAEEGEVVEDVGAMVNVVFEQVERDPVAADFVAVPAFVVQPVRHAVSLSFKTASSRAHVVGTRSAPQTW